MKTIPKTGLAKFRSGFHNYKAGDSVPYEREGVCFTIDMTNSDGQFERREMPEMTFFKNFEIVEQ